MLYLLNKTDKIVLFTLTKNPMSRSGDSPQPTGKRLEDLNSEIYEEKLEIEAILRHPSYSEAT